MPYLVRAIRSSCSQIRQCARVGERFGNGYAALFSISPIIVKIDGFDHVHADCLKDQPLKAGLVIVNDDGRYRLLSKEAAENASAPDSKRCSC